MRRYSLTAGLAAAILSISMGGAFASQQKLTPLETEALANHDMISGDADLAAPAKVPAKVFVRHATNKVPVPDMLVQEVQAAHA